MEANTNNNKISNFLENPTMEDQVTYSTTEEQLAQFAEKAIAKAKTEILAEVERKSVVNATPIIAVTNEKANTNELLGNWLNGVSRKDVTAVQEFRSNYPQLFEKAAFSEASNGAGLYTVPTVWASEIFANVEKYGFARKLAKVMPQQSYKMNLQKGGAVTVAYPGIDTAPTPFDATSFFTQTVLTLNTVTGGVAVSKDLINESASQILPYLTDQYAIALAKEEDAQFFKGSGSPFTGLCTVSGTNVVYQGNASNSGKDTFAEVSWTDLVNVVSATNTVVQQRAKFVMSQTIWGILNKELAGSRPVWDYLRPTTMKNTAGVDVMTYATPLGFEAVVVPNDIMPTDAVTTASVLFGDFSRSSIIGVNQGMTVEVFDQAWAGVDLAGTRQVALVAGMRHSIGHVLPSAVTVLKTSTT